MNVFDLIALGVIVLAAAVGTLRGGVRELLSLLCWALALAAAWLFSEPLAADLGRGGDPLLARIAAAALVFSATLVLATLGAWLLRRIWFRGPPGAAGRVLGATLGALRGLAVVLLLVMLAGLTALPQQSWWRDSLLAPYYEGTARRILQWLPPELARQFRYPGEATPRVSAEPSGSGRIPLYAQEG